MDQQRSSLRDSALAYIHACAAAHGYGLYLGNGRGGALFAPAQHCLLALGPPRAGKTTALAIPNILAAAGPVIAVSTKPDMLDVTLSTRRRLGRCMLFDPSESIERAHVDLVGWTPLTSALSWDAAVLTAEAMVGATHNGGSGKSHWGERAGALLASLLHGAALAQMSIEELVGALNRRDAAPFLSVLARHEALLAVDVLVGIVETDAREQSGIWSTASGILAAYRMSSSIRSAARPAFDAGAFVVSRDTLYLCAPGDVQAHVAPLVAGLLRDVRSAAYARAGSSAAPIAPPLLLVLDELANIAPLHDLPSLIAEGGSQGVVTIGCLQDLSQARARWGNAADGFLSLFGSKVILHGIGDPRTLEAVSLIAGETEVPAVSTGRHRRFMSIGSDRSRSTSARSLRRLPPNRVADGDIGRAILVLGAKVGELELTPAYRTRPWSDLL